MKNQQGGSMKLIRKILVPITMFLFIIIIIIILYIQNNLNKNKYSHIEQENSLLKDENQEMSENIEKPIRFHIDIKGAVNNPGVYLIESNSTVSDAINLAGGLREDADTSIINLAKRISDEMVIIVYTKEEVKNSNIVDTVIKVVEQECICPNIENDSCINTDIKDNITNNEEEKLININTATKEELQTINGIGESKANNIIKYRETIGNFKNIEDIKNVEGIGETLYETIKIYITT